MDDGNVNVAESQAFFNQMKAAGKAIDFETVPTGDHYDSMIEAGIPKGIEWIKKQIQK